ncbi:MAG: hypothetical protein RLZ12_24 [Bacillota bacterium]
MELLKPYNDFVFKRIFGSEENKNEVLLNFLNVVVRRTCPLGFQELVLVDPHLEKDAADDKKSILDIKAVNSDGEQVNIEMQVADKGDMIKRSLYYWADLYQEQLPERKVYDTLKKTIVINILGYNLFGHDIDYHTIYRLREETTNRLLTEDQELHFIELKKIKNQNFDELQRWMIFIKGEQQDSWEDLSKNTPGLKKAITSLEFLSQDKEARALYKAREKALRDELSAREFAKKKGLAEGRVEGRVEGKVTVAKNLLKAGMSISEVAKVSELEETEVERLKMDLS